MTSPKTSATKASVGARKAGAAKQSAAKTDAKRPPKSATDLRKGDHVAWSTSQGDTQGVVERKVTHTMHIKDHKVSASPDNPEYVVRSDKSGAIAAHKPGSLRKIASKKKAK